MRAFRHLVFAALIPLAACDAAQPEDNAPAADAPAEAPAQARGAAAQNGFEGVITATATSDGERTESVMRVKDSRWRLEMEMDGERGAIIRDRNGRMMSLIESTRQYMYLPELEGEDDPMQFTATGQSETVAGHQCRYYRIRDPNGVQDGDEVCVTTELGFVGFGPSGPFGAADERTLRQQFRDGFLILKSRDPRGAVEYEVTRIERTSVSDAMFAPPPGYTELQRPGLGIPPRRP
jgi:hypothetical protein